MQELTEPIADQISVIAGMDRDWRQVFYNTSNMMVLFIRYLLPLSECLILLQLVSSMLFSFSCTSWRGCLTPPVASGRLDL
jgi:hypothetical protein